MVKYFLISCSFNFVSICPLFPFMSCGIFFLSLLKENLFTKEVKKKELILSHPLAYFLISHKSTLFFLLFYILLSNRACEMEFILSDNYRSAEKGMN